MSLVKSRHTDRQTHPPTDRPTKRNLIIDATLFLFLKKSQILVSNLLLIIILITLLIKKHH